MLGAIQYHLRHLADFTGRDARQTFWYWFLALFIVNIVASTIATVPIMIETMTIGFEAARNGNPEAAQATMMSAMGDRVASMIVLSLVLGAANLLLIAAAFVRRLHDSGKSGIWALVAGVVYVVSLLLTWSRADDAAALMREIAAAQDPDTVFAMQSKMAWEGLLGYVPLVMVIGFGLLKSDPEPNRFGEEPVRF